MKQPSLLLEKRALLPLHECYPISTLPLSPVRNEDEVGEKWVASHGSKWTKGVWYQLIELLQVYFRIEVEGLENVPSQGPAVIISNHSGYTALDAIMIAYLIHSKLGRASKIMTHRIYFDWSSWVRSIAQSIGLIRADMKSGLQTLHNGQLLLLFPEGESGNFKPSTKRYQLQRFQSGFLRMAETAQTPIIPAVVIGAEESFLNFGHIDLSHFVDRLKIPLPITWFPLPAKWKIRFLKPLELSSSLPALTLDHKNAEQTCESIRDSLQTHIHHELNKRPYVYFPYF